MKDTTKSDCLMSICGAAAERMVAQYDASMKLTQEGIDWIQARSSAMTESIIGKLQ